MSQPTSPAARAAAEAYCARLRLPPERRAELLAAALSSDAPVAELHRLLDPDGFDAANPAFGSIAPRLQMALDGATRRGEPLAGQAFTEDVQGRVRLASSPRLQRASFIHRPWSPNPLKQLLGWIGGLLLGPRGGHLLRDYTGNAPEPDAPEPVGRWHVAASVRRFILVFLMLSQTAVATFYMTAVLPYHGNHPLEVAMLVLFAVLFAWVSAGFWTAMMGFLQLLIGQDRYTINSRRVPADARIADGSRTAILMPICNENTARVFAGLRATYDSVMRSGYGPTFEFFILSDTSDPDIRVAELEAWLQLCRDTGGFGRIHYRRRRHRIKRKSGNIADWCRRWGAGFRYMVILDADSVMSGGCLVRLTQLMEANPSAGIIQTAPRASGRETLYARIQQFATRVYGPLFTAGLHFWQLGESHYWGHNAIIRVQPFLDHCGLPRLPGRGALSGEILSHDFVEAALMRRAGWAVWIAYDLDGSYEEMPPNLLDELKRDRRWCQGNLMNFRLFLTSGLHPAHRAVFMTGVMAYLSAPLWFVSLLLSTALLATQTFAEPQYFTEPNQLFPSWPEWHPEWAIALFGATATLLFLPKVLAIVVILAQGSRNFGGGVILTLSMLMELVFSALLAPVRMLFHAHFVTAALLGLGIVWKSPPREDSATPWSEAIARHGFGTVLGLGWAALVYILEPAFLWWLLPVVGALALAIPLSVWSSKTTLGQRFRAWRFFLIPEEAVPPRELRWTALGFRRAPDYGDFRAAVVDPVTNALACAAGTARPYAAEATRRARLALLQTALIQGPARLDAIQKNMLLTDSVALSRLHHLVWTAPEVHADWGTKALPALS
jgi:membrane glycosyltransferase